MPLDRIKVIIIGQDPYPIPNVATGLAFGVSNDVEDKDIPPSLKIIQAELALNYYNDPTYSIKDKSLESWEAQGVLLLNASLTCDHYSPEGVEYLFKPGSHSNFWRTALMEPFIQWLDIVLDDVVFVFLGRKAQYYSNFVKCNSQLSTYHPVADYRIGKQLFVGSLIFNKINEILNEKKKETIKW